MLLFGLQDSVQLLFLGLTKAAGLVEVNMLEDPTYLVADDALA